MVRRAYIDEIFSSIQGEGIYLGKVQFFIRFSGCNLNCRFCDSQRALRRWDFALVEKEPHSGSFRKMRNPIAKEKLVNIVNKFDKNNTYYHSISLTGGEPLCQADFLKLFLKGIKSSGKKIYLETNGTLPEELRKVVGLLDIISMDVKLPSSSGQQIIFSNVERFLKLAASKDLFVKVVITARSRIEELNQVCRMIARLDKSIPFILQPVSSTRKFKNVPDVEKLLLMARASKAVLSNVRVIPQMHKALKIK